jgi:hypothetical protein
MTTTTPQASSWLGRPRSSRGPTAPASHSSSTIDGLLHRKRLGDIQSSLVRYFPSQQKKLGCCLPAAHRPSCHHESQLLASQRTAGWLRLVHATTPWSPASRPVRFDDLISKYSAHPNQLRHGEPLLHSGQHTRGHRLRPLPLIPPTWKRPWQPSCPRMLPATVSFLF